MLRSPGNCHDTLLTSEFLPVMKNAVDVALDSWLKGEDGKHKEIQYIKSKSVGCVFLIAPVLKDPYPACFTCSSGPLHLFFCF